MSIDCSCCGISVVGRRPFTLCSGSGSTSHVYCVFLWPPPCHVNHENRLGNLITIFLHQVLDYHNVLYMILDCSRVVWTALYSLYMPMYVQKPCSRCLYAADQPQSLLTCPPCSTYSGLKAGQKYVSDSGLVVFMYILNFVVFKATKINL